MQNRDVKVRALQAGDEALGRELVTEYVLATAVEMTEPGVVPMSLEQLLPFMPDLHDFGARYFQGGAFLVAFDGEEVAGCVGVCPATKERCEMNRLWVRPRYRGLRLADLLVEASLAAARQLGFSSMSLDVLTLRERARRLYERHGFLKSKGYHDYPFAMVALEKAL
jgi:ribosomal protein S18 acetylase RimI-like enzyme